MLHSWLPDRLIRYHFIFLHCFYYFHELVGLWVENYLHVVLRHFIGLVHHVWVHSRPVVLVVALVVVLAHLVHLISLLVVFKVDLEMLLAVSWQGIDNLNLLLLRKEQEVRDWHPKVVY